MKHASCAEQCQNPLGPCGATCVFLVSDPLERAKARMGERYLLHPANRVKRLPSPLPDLYTLKTRCTSCGGTGYATRQRSDGSEESGCICRRCLGYGFVETDYLKEKAE